MTLEPGTRMGVYEIVAPVGAGAMGEVYRARDTKLDREVAIKVLPEELARDRERLERFEREARLLARVNHPNIATLHGLEGSAGQQYIVMELVEGETLADRITAGAIPPDEVVPLFSQIAEGLEAAHAKGIVHRDLKPANIKLSSSGRIKILDFGLAKAPAAKTASSNVGESPTMSRGTETGVILGTAPYMSPEQARGVAVDKRTDVWAFGCCLFEALTERPPFLGETVTDTIVQIVEREPDWTMLPETTPTSLCRVLRRCLQKDPDRRIRDIGDARIELDESDVEMGGSGAGPPTGRDGRRRRRWWAAAAIGIALMAVAWWHIGSPRSPSDATMARLLVSLSPADGLAYGGTDLRIQSAGGFPVAVSPDGTHIAYVGMVKDVEGRQLYIRDLAEEEGRLVRESDDAEDPFFSPDGEWVGFFSGGFLKKVSVAGGVPISVCEAPAPRGGSWNEDGQIVFAPISRAGLSIVSADGGSPIPLTVLDDEYGETSHRIPEFLPGGDAVLFLAEGGTRQETRVVVHSLISGERRVLVEQATLPRFSPTGHLLFVQGGTSMAVPFDIERLEMSGRAVQVLPVTSTFYAMSGTGTLVYLADEVLEGMKRLVWVGPDGSEEPLAAPVRNYLHPRLSPQGHRVAVDIEQEGDRNVWTYDFERETLERLTFDGSNLWPTWSPDGSTVAYASNRPGTGWDALARRADGTGVDEVLWSGELEQIPRSWSSDGETLAVSTIDPETRSDIWLISAREGAPRAWRQTAAVEVEAAISPNGKWIAYTSNETGQAEIYVGRVSGSGKWQISIAGGREPVWAKDGTALFYWEGNVLNVARVSTGDTFVHETPTELLQGAYYRTSTGQAAYDVDDDGRFLMVRPEPVTPPKYLDVVLNWSRELEELVPTEN